MRLSNCKRIKDIFVIWSDLQVTDVAKDSVEFEVFENSPPDFLERIPKIALAQFEEDSLNNRFLSIGRNNDRCSHSHG